MDKKLNEETVKAKGLEVAIAGLKADKEQLEGTAMMWDILGKLNSKNEMYNEMKAAYDKLKAKARGKGELNKAYRAS